MLDNLVEAYKFYHNAFGVDKISDDMLPNGDHYIMVDINGCNILIRPGEKLTDAERYKNIARWVAKARGQNPDR